MGSRKGGPGNLKDLLQDMFRRAGLEKKFRQGQILLAWKELVGPANARHSWPVRIQEDVLRVSCSSPAWAQTLSLLRGRILAKIAQQYGGGLLRDIHFTGLGERGEENAEAEEASPPPGKIPLSPEAQQRIKDLTQDISDPQLREKAEAALASLLRQRQWYEARGERPCLRCGRIFRGAKELCPSCKKILEKEQPNAQAE
jgi:predicted nucleic acid-binding Zn ribbon protein